MTWRKSGALIQLKMLDKMNRRFDELSQRIYTFKK